MIQGRNIRHHKRYIKVNYLFDLRRIHFLVLSLSDNVSKFLLRMDIFHFDLQWQKIAGGSEYLIWIYIRHIYIKCRRHSFIFNFLFSFLGGSGQRFSEVSDQSKSDSVKCLTYCGTRHKISQASFLSDATVYHSKSWHPTLSSLTLTRFVSHSLQLNLRRYNVPMLSPNIRQLSIVLMSECGTFFCSGLSVDKKNFSDEPSVPNTWTDTFRFSRSLSITISSVLWSDLLSCAIKLQWYFYLNDNYTAMINLTPDDVS